ncbi:ribonuclease H-like domain-containing protein, partial [Tanacetum coccineum]
HIGRPTDNGQVHIKLFELQYINWYDVMWFSNCIPRYAFHFWLVMKRKLKTQDTLRQWDVSSNANLNLLQCPLCESQLDSHDHLFFECVFSLQVWSHVKIYVGLPTVSVSLSAITDHIIPMSKKKNARSVIAKLVFAATSYFIWQERNNRLFKNQKRSRIQVIECILSTVRLKLLTWFFPLGFTWEGFLKRQSQLAVLTPDVQLWDRFGPVISEEYSLEYGTDKIEMHVGVVQEKERALVIDDLIATRGTLWAAINLLERAEVNVLECACVIELPELKNVNAKSMYFLRSSYQVNPISPPVTWVNKPPPCEEPK